MKLVQVWIEYSAAALDRPFTYASFDEHIQRGIRVEVLFANRRCIGFVDEVKDTNQSLEEASLELGYRIGVIEKCLDAEPLLNDELYDLADWLAKHTVSSHISCFQVMLPAKLKPQSGNHQIKMETWVKSTDFMPESLTLKQKEALLYIRDKQEILLSEWRQLFKSVGKMLEEKGSVIQFQKEASFIPFSEGNETSFLHLTDLQKKAIESIQATDKTITLLHGVTGSGKTEIYLQLAAEVVKQGRQVLILVPEISLTPQMVKRVKSRFQQKVAIYHSALNNQEKYEQFKRVKNCEIDVVVGTRSAVFMPFQQLGLIIMDEEHDTSYKQENTPQYHCRDVAVWRAERHQCQVVLGSATPSLESYARAIKSVYHLVEMPQRINNQMPTVTTINTKQAMEKGQSYILTEPLKEKMQHRLDAHEQIILLLNRRGYSPSVRCTQCTEVIQCPHCDLALSYHRSDQTMKCHSCGYSIPLMKECPSCHSHSLMMTGVGTQKLVEEIEKSFPNAKVIRMDADTTTRKNSHEMILKQVENHQVDILVGTQMIAKGIDFPEVTLVGIINGDAGLNRSDYRSVEMNFQLIVQAAGRSGRASKPGEVIIQAFDPQHYAIQYGATQDYLGFFKKEMNYRHLSNNPPYSYLISVVISDIQKERAAQDSHQFLQWLKMEEVAKVLGPSELYKLQDYYRFRLVLKGKDLVAMVDAVWRCHQLALKKKLKSRIKVDTSPMMLE